MSLPSLLLRCCLPTPLPHQHALSVCVDVSVSHFSPPPLLWLLPPPQSVTLFRSLWLGLFISLESLSPLFLHFSSAFSSSLPHPMVLAGVGSRPLSPFLSFLAGAVSSVKFEERRHKLLISSSRLRRWVLAGVSPEPAGTVLRSTACHLQAYPRGL